MRFPHAHNNMVEMLQNQKKESDEGIKKPKEKKIFYAFLSEMIT
jgi:hypothetical protein